MKDESPDPRYNAALKTLESLADLTKVIASASTASEAMVNVLRLLCLMFDAEGAVFWQVDDRQQQLALKQTFHQEGERGSSFLQLAQLQTLRFGEGEAGHVWAEGEPRLNGQQMLTLPLFGPGTINGVISLVNSSFSSGFLSTADRLLLNVISTQLGSFISMDGLALRAQELEARNDALASRLHSADQELRGCKARVSRWHEESVQEALTNYRLFNRLSRELRTPLSGIISIIELLQRTDLTDKQREQTSIIEQSAHSILDVVRQLVEAGSRNNRHLAVEQLRQEKAMRRNGTRTLSDARVLSVIGLVGSSEYIEPYATASGITCHIASRGNSALTMMRQALDAGRPFDVIFVEMVLPDMDGYEFAKSVRQDRQLARMPMVLVSTFGAAGEDSALTAGYYAHIARPIKQAQVVNTVQAVLDGTSVDAAVSAPQVHTMPAILKGQHVILIAEDNPVNQKVALLQLKELGYCAEVAVNGEEAVEAAKQGVFDAILMDLQMPKFDGIDATRQIREWEQQTGNHVPIIAMTANALPADRERCLAAGMDDYMSKPVTYDQLSDVLSKWLDVESVQSVQKNREDSMANQSNTNMDFTPEAQPPESGMPVDVAVLSEMLGPEEAVEILKLFVVSSQELMDKINQSLGSQDATTLKEAAHTLKGACSSIGANPMWRQCLELEKLAKSADWSDLPKAYSNLEHRFQEAKDFISNNL